MKRAHSTHDNTTQENVFMHPCLNRGSNRPSHCSIDAEPHTPWDAQQLLSALNSEF